MEEKMIAKKTIVVCMPGLSFSNVWVAAWTALLTHLQSLFEVRVAFGYSNNIYITRNTILAALLKDDENGIRFDYALWLDDDNPLDVQGFHYLMGDLEDNPTVHGVMGWYWLQPHGVQMEPMVSCGLLSKDTFVHPLKPEEMFKGNELVSIEYGGFGSFLVRWDAMKEVGRNSFTPILLDGGERFTGDDISYFVRAKKLGHLYGVDKRVKVAHLKLRNADFDPDSFVVLPDEIKGAELIQGWMTRMELVWLFEQAKKMGSVVEIGSWKGRSTFALARGCKGEVVCVDTWEGSTDVFPNRKSLKEEAAEVDVFSEFLKNTEQFENVAALVKDSISASKKVADADMIFIDASHEFEDVVKDLEAWQGKAKKLLCGHDIDRAEVRAALVQSGLKWQKGPGRIWFVEAWQGKEKEKKDVEKAYA